MLKEKPSGVTTQEISERLTGVKFDRVILRKLRQLHKYGFLERNPLDPSRKSPSLYTLVE